VNTAPYWDGGYGQWPEALPYGSEETYAEVGWLGEVCASIEDWGAGPAWARRFVPEGVDYLPVDFAANAIRAGWSEVLADLATYASTRPDGIFMRHVLEHNDSWAEILANAVGSFRKRMVLVTFIPLVAETFLAGPESPGRDWNFAREDLTGLMGGLLVSDYGVVSRTAYGGEHVFRLERP
jgi:hypothetical protein